MSVLQVNLENQVGLRLTRCRHSNERNTPMEHALNRDTERMINEDPEHGKYGPWTVKSSNWIA